MSRYETIAADYDTYRSRSIGVSTLIQWLGAPESNVSVLDLGCGTGTPIAKALAGRVRHYMGVECSVEMARRFRKAVPVAECILADVATVDLGSLMFDLCFSWGALCHLRPEAQCEVLPRVVRHTKVGGTILFTGGRDAGSCDGWIGPHRVRHYSIGADAYDQLLVSNGCEPQFKGEVEDGAAYLFVYRRTG